MLWYYQIYVTHLEITLRGQMYQMYYHFVFLYFDGEPTNLFKLGSSTTMCKISFHTTLMDKNYLHIWRTILRIHNVLPFSYNNFTTLIITHSTTCHFPYILCMYCYHNPIKEWSKLIGKFLWLSVKKSIQLYDSHHHIITIVH